MRRFFEYFELFREIACQSVLRPLIFAPSQHNAALQSRRGAGCGVDRKVGAAKFAALTAAKKVAETVDETKKALHNLVSLLQTTQQR
ncbi:hypothetical protein [Cupriavidus necator]|uniref:hypothetical protein n=1 Tax=Cupriavidus necator TaxID=106590 RepID=UPI0020C003CB|nr:hypothetical protein [Cupriavidus necator]